jgi:hypothetical protein
MWGCGPTKFRVFSAGGALRSGSSTQASPSALHMCFDIIADAVIGSVPAALAPALPTKAAWRLRVTPFDSSNPVPDSMTSALRTMPSRVRSLWLLDVAIATIFAMSTIASFGWELMSFRHRRHCDDLLAGLDMFVLFRSRHFAFPCLVLFSLDGSSQIN